MPNYLERVVTAGARTDTLLRPTAAAPPLLPGFERLWLPPSELAEMALASPALLQEGERSMPREPMPPAAVHSALPAMPAAQATRQDAGAHEAHTLLQAPITLRPASQPATARATTEPPSHLASRPTPSPGLSAAAPPPQPGEEAASQLPAHSALPTMLAAQATRQDAGAHEAYTLLQAPITLRPASQPATARATTEPPSHLALRPASSPGVSAAAPPPQPGEEAASSQPVTDIARFRPMAMDAGASATAGTLYSLQPHAQLLPEQVTAPPTMRPAPIWQAPSASLPSSSSGHQNRITIGRIDVQVNNHPSVIPSSPPPTASALPLDNLETRFLNRFPIRP